MTSHHPGREGGSARFASAPGGTEQRSGLLLLIVIVIIIIVITVTTIMIAIIIVIIMIIAFGAPRSGRTQRL